MGNCKTCVYRIFDPLWTEYKCRLKKVTVRNVDTLICPEYKKGEPANYVEPKEPIVTPSKPTKPTPPTSSTPGSCESCIYHVYNPLWTVHKCRLKKVELQNGILTDCKEYVKGNSCDYVEPKEPEPGPPSYKRITENGNYKASKDGVIGYNEIDVQVPVTVVEHDDYKGLYKIKPEVHERTLPTKNKVMTDNLKVLAIPYYETSNHKHGTTVIIGD